MLAVVDNIDSGNHKTRKGNHGTQKLEVATGNAKRDHQQLQRAVRWLRLCGRGGFGN